MFFLIFLNLSKIKDLEERFDQMEYSSAEYKDLEDLR